MAPTSRGAKEVRSRLLNGELSAILCPQVLTFERLSREVLAASKTEVRLLGGAHRRQLIRHLIREASQSGTFEHFADIAQTDGLISQIEAFISELKRLEIWPEELAESCQRRGAAAKDKEFLALYEAYQETLRRHQLFDAEGCTWAARANLKNGQTAPYESLRLIAVDGFTDFTRTQHEILEILAQRVEELVISLPLEIDSRRPELFEKTRQTLEDLQRRHANCQIVDASNQEDGDHGATPTAIGALSETIFVPSRQREQLANTRGIEVIAAAQQIGEIREVARRVKHLLVRGARTEQWNREQGDQSHTEGPVPAAEIAVVFRSLSEVAPLVREVFAEYGVPISLETREPLGRSPLLKVLESLLRLAHEDWPYRRLLAIVTHTQFRPHLAMTEGHPQQNEPADVFNTAAASFRAPGVQAAEQQIRDLQIAKGSRELLRAVERLSQREPREGNAERVQRDEQSRARAKSSLPLLKTLDEALAQLPKRADLEAWSLALGGLLRELGFLPDEPRPEDEDHLALRKLTDTLSTGSRYSKEFSGSEREYDLEQLLSVLSDILECEHLPKVEDREGRIQVLTAPGIRTLSVDYLFVAGLSEQAFPPPLEMARLYSDAETARLIDAGLPLPTRQQRGHEEMLLFYEVITRAKRQLTLSYPATDSKGEPLLPSPYLDEVIRLCGREQLGLQPVTNLRPLPTIDVPHSPLEMRIEAIEKALAGDPGRLADVVGKNASDTGATNLLPAISAVQSRSDRDYGPYEGVLSSAAVEARLHERFGQNRAWSPSHLEQYAACPHQFYLEQILGLEPLPDLALEDDHLARGSLLHHTLAAVHRELNRVSKQPVSPADGDAAEFLRQFDDILGQLVESWGSPGAVERALREVDRRRLLGWADRYLAQHAKYDRQFEELDQRPKPELFEVGFGPTRTDEDADSHSTREPLILRSGDDEIQIAGRVDRVDVGACEGVPVFNVIDYKSGSKVQDKPEQIAAGLALQLPLYAMAVQQLGLVAEGAVPWQAGYWRVRTEGYPKRNSLKFYEPGDGQPRPTADWQQLREVIVSRVASLIRGIRMAEFPMHSADDKCTERCSFARNCRVNQTRSLDKQWTSPTEPSAEGDVASGEANQGDAK